MFADLITGRVALIAALAIIVIVPLPSVVAKLRNHPNKREIYVLNVVLIWTNIGWFILLAWALWGKESKRLQELRSKWRRG